MSLGIGAAGLGGGGIVAPYIGSAVALPPPPTLDVLSEAQRKNILATLKLIDGSCVRINITSVSKDIKRATGYVGGTYPDRERTKFHIEHITARIIDELERQLFLHVDGDKSKHYKQTDPFGSDVGKRFAKAAEDIANAGNCYALGQNTACVFHLMRVMEYCVQRFGKKLNVPIDVSKESWHQVMLHVHKQVDALPGGAKATKAQNVRKQAFATAASRLDHVRLAWRNDVMHPKATYDEAEALEVLTSVRAFVTSIVKLV